MPTIPLRVRLAPGHEPLQTEVQNDASPEQLQRALAELVTRTTGQPPQDSVLKTSSEALAITLKVYRAGGIDTLPTLDLSEAGYRLPVPQRPNQSGALKAPPSSQLGPLPDASVLTAREVELLTQVSKEPALSQSAEPSPLKEARENGYLPYDAAEMATLHGELIKEAETSKRAPFSPTDKEKISAFLDQAFSNWTSMSAHDMHHGSFQNIPDLNTLLRHATQAISESRRPETNTLRRGFARLSDKNLLVLKGMDTYRSRFMDVLPPDRRTITGDPVTVRFVRLLSPFANKTAVLSAPEMDRLQTDIFPKLMDALTPCYRRFRSNKEPLGSLDSQVKRLPYADNKNGRTHFLPWLHDQLAEWTDGDCGHLVCQRMVEVLENTVDVRTDGNSSNR